MNPATGGPCQGIRNSIPVLEEMGIHREVVSLDSPDEAFIGRDDFPIHALGPKQSAWHYSPKLKPWLQQNLQKFDVIIVNGLWVYPGYAVTKVLRKMRKNGDTNIPKLFVMPHGMLDPYFQKASHRKIKAIRNWVYWKAVESKIIHAAEGILFTCKTEMELARETFRPYQPKRELNVGYGVAKPPPFVAAMRSALHHKLPQLIDKTYLLFLSRIHNKKGIDMLIRAYQTYHATNPDAPMLVIAGPGIETVFGKKLKRSVINEKLSDSILFTGMLTGDLKWGAMYECEAFILPSHQENFGIAVVEAMACKKAVLISNQINIWKEIETEGGGIVAEDTIKGTLSLLQQWGKLTGLQKEEKGNYSWQCYQKYFTTEVASKNLYSALNQVCLLLLPLLDL